MLADCVDGKKTTEAILRQWRDREFVLANAGERIEEIETRLTNATTRLGSTPVTGGGGNKADDALVNGLYRMELERRSVQSAEEFFHDLLPFWNRLAEEEQWLLTIRYVDGSGSWLREAKTRLHVEDREAYRRSTAALLRLARMLFG